MCKFSKTTCWGNWRKNGGGWQLHTYKINSILGKLYGWLVYINFFLILWVIEFYLNLILLVMPKKSNLILWVVGVKKKVPSWGGHTFFWNSPYLNSDGQQFYQYQLKWTTTFHLQSLNTQKKIMIYTYKNIVLNWDRYKNMVGLNQLKESNFVAFGLFVILYK